MSILWDRVKRESSGQVEGLVVKLKQIHKLASLFFLKIEFYFIM